MLQLSPTSFVASCAKIFKHIVEKRIRDDVEMHKSLCGFDANYGTINAVHQIVTGKTTTKEQGHSLRVPKFGENV